MFMLDTNEKNWQQRIYMNKNKYRLRLLVYT